MSYNDNQRKSIVAKRKLNLDLSCMYLKGESPIEIIGSKTFRTRT